ncbi:hypothetical protein RFI_26574 [Reticulomyxa filosa]|uniref:ABC-2 type transporter transmembrane domain-containing protein n=1 Tax=Reticulomyxa filosa TaxID=46433 RepID=X6MBG2_RETFI|nr:hypothetical protein RFI_26574 [Reticulomyxa filosa]|eukprot:ETO10802.1 hypothetical protein RFI_26574 [Reticulomyxa filosa]
MFRGAMYFPMERQVIRKERQSGAYQLSSYYIGKIMAEFPVDTSLPMMAVCIYYWLVGLGDSAPTFILYILSTCLTVWVASSFGTMIGCTLMDFERAITALSVSGIFLMLLGGFYVQTKEIPVWISWIGYLSHFRWAVTSTENITMRHVSFSCASDGASSYTLCSTHKRIPGLEVLKNFGTDTRPWIGPVAMIALSCGWHCIAYYGLRKNTAVKNAMGEGKELQVIEETPKIPTKTDK